MEVTEFVLRSIYMSGGLPILLLPEDPPQQISFLLKVLEVADRYQAESSRERCASALSATPSSDISNEAVVSANSTPTTILKLPSLSGFMSACKEALERLYGDVIAMCLDSG